MAADLTLSIYLASKEIWRNQLRFALVAGIVALITVLVLFIAALNEGLGLGNREYLAQLNADLLVYQRGANLSIPASRITQANLQALRRTDGVAAAGAIGLSDTSVLLPAGAARLKVRLLGVIPGLPGEPPVTSGHGFGRSGVREAVIDGNVAGTTGARVGDNITIISREGNNEKPIAIRVIGISTSQQFTLQPTVFLPYETWNQLLSRPEGTNAADEVSFNIAAVRLRDPSQGAATAIRLAQATPDIQIVDRVTAYEAIPGYLAQDRTFTIQKWCLLIIGALVIGGFFQIQLLQRVAQVGVLRAIGIARGTVALTFLFQVLLITALGIVLGGLATLAFAGLLPASVPVAFTPPAIATTVGLLLLTGPIGSSVALRALLKIEPLAALQLTM
jgi:putative ABC transport system permease protein